MKRGGTTQHYITLLLLLTLAIPIHAQTTRPAHSLGDQPAKSWRLTPLNELRASAEAGIPEAQFELSDRLDLGRGVKKDPIESEKWLRKSADADSTEAQLRLAARLIKTPADQPEAARLFRAAADKGDPRAQYELGDCYKSGQGVSADDTEALKWFIKSADQNNPDAACEVGEAYQVGRGAPKDFALALKYFLRAADQNNGDAACHIAHMYRDGEGVRTDSKEMLAWYNKAVARGSIDATWELAQMYRDGQIVPKNTQLAIPLLKKLAVQRHAKAQESLASLAPQSIVQIAKPLIFRGEDPEPAQVGEVVRVDGRLEAGKKHDKKWTLVVKSGSREFNLPVDAPADPGKAKNGMSVSVYGTLTEAKSVHGLLVSAVAPTFDITYDLKKPNTIIAGRTQKYSIDGKIKNTGKQPVTKIKLHVRFYQDSSPNDETKDVTVDSVSPGAEKKFTASVNWHNYQYAGATSEPRIEVEVISYEW